MTFRHVNDVSRRTPMCGDVSIRRWFALACLACPIFGMALGLHAAEEDRSTCFDANAIPSIRATACTQIIDASETSDQVRLSAYLNRAAANYRADKLDDAIRDYSKFISAQPASAIAFHDRGLAYLKASQFSDAIADFSEAIRLNAKYATAYNNRGIAYGKIKNNQKALLDFDLALQLDPWYATALYNRSLTYFDNAEYERATIDLKKAIEIQPSNPDLYNQLAWTYLKMGMALKGLHYANQSLGIKPSANAYDTRGAVYEAVGNVAQAIDDYGRALSLNPSLDSSAQALKRLLTKKEVSSDGAKSSALISELTQLVQTHGWQVDMGRMCTLMKLSLQSECKFKQISVKSDVPNTVDDNGFNVPEFKNPQYVVIYRFTPLVGNFFVVSLDGTVKSAFFRAKGIDYTEVSLADTRQAFEASIGFWKEHLETIKGMIAAGGLRK
jgi:tetratricopeptide (TPR) repeat protein